MFSKGPLTPCIGSPWMDGFKRICNRKDADLGYAGGNTSEAWQRVLEVWLGPCTLISLRPVNTVLMQQVDSVLTRADRLCFYDDHRIANNRLLACVLKLYRCQVTSIDLSNCGKLTDKCLLHLSSVNLSELQELCLMGCKKLSDQGVADFFLRLKADSASTCMHTIDLSCCSRVSSGTANSLSAYCTCPAVRTNLTHLDLSGCSVSIADVGVIGIVHALALPLSGG